MGGGSPRRTAPEYLKERQEHLDDAREKNDLSLIQKYSNILIKNDPLQ